MTVGTSHHRLVSFVTLLFLAILLGSCGSSDVVQSLSAEERFQLGMKKFEEGDYLEAIDDFQIVKLQYMGSNVADDAQYYLAECHYRREDYLLAAEEYRTLRRTMATSPLAPEAQYKIAMCYYQLAPRPTLDQQYAIQAIDEFQTFVEYYPTNTLRADAETKIKELNSRLAQKLFESAEVYMKLDYYKSAAIYYRLIAEKYHDTPYAEPALLGAVRALVARNRYDEAKTELDKFFERFPESSLRSEAESLRSQVEDHLRTKSAASGSDESSKLVGRRESSTKN